MLRPRPEIEYLHPAIHGGEIDTAEGRAPAGADVLDFSVSTNPLGPEPWVTRDLEYEVGRYPDSRSTDLRLKLASRLGVEPEQIAVGNGSMDLIRNAALAYFGRGDRVLVAGPTFGEYAVQSKISGATVLELLPDPIEKLRLGPDEILHAASENGAKGIILCNPNNPTGQYLGQDAIRWMLARFPDGLLVVDEAYVTFTEDRWRSESLLTAGNLLIIRSMTKDYALAGLRLGYGLAANPVLDPINRVTLPWSVNSVAQQAGLRCLDLGEEYLDQVRDYALRGARTLQQGFRELGFQVAPSQAHFFLVKVGDAQLFQSRLLREGILVRDCSSFGLDAWIRVSPRRSEDNELLLQAVGRLSR